MAACTACGKPAGFMMSACESCLAKQSAADTGGSAAAATVAVSAKPADGGLATAVAWLCIGGGCVGGAIYLIEAVTRAGTALGWATASIGLICIVSGLFSGALLLTLDRIARAVERRPG